MGPHQIIGPIEMHNGVGSIADIGFFLEHGAGHTLSCRCKHPSEARTTTSIFSAAVELVCLQVHILKQAALRGPYLLLPNPNITTHN
jgi:hypothetical protein